MQEFLLSTSARAYATWAGGGEQLHLGRTESRGVFGVVPTVPLRQLSGLGRGSLGRIYNGTSLSYLALLAVALPLQIVLLISVQSSGFDEPSTIMRKVS